jgi:hypothetical protein
MPCIPFGDKETGGFICTPTYTKHAVRVVYCPKCKQRRRVKFGFEKWYGWSGTCRARRKWRNGHEVECGQHFSDE